MRSEAEGRHTGRSYIPLLLNGELQFSEADFVAVLTAISKSASLVGGAVIVNGLTPATVTPRVQVSDKSIKLAIDLFAKK